ncbi:polysaccharide biosynthesis/export family protein [Amaricoccus sp.]|uniref:polysaccharide biosynthesis/export family protein n=1 Tax=Amaricoccus sp. TaxID=1872485 RepID=UPI001B4F49EC|nr:polysaccharide biosynthesis/export family protein [Amaricoccus sp.]MBP7242360.1 polysaccharide biosynthesis/export family protein [Amaricoccus sp.]
MPIPTLLRRAQALLILAFACAAGSAPADEYPLAPGDTVRLQVAGIEQFSSVASVSNDGFVSLPRFGRVRAEGRTVEEVQSTLQEMVGSITFRVFDASRLASVLDVAPSDVALEVERYRDVTVSGMVTSPRLIPFSSGLTVRSAIAAAGGILGQGLDAGGTDPSGMVLRVAEISRLTRARAETLATIWRLENALGESRPAPTAAELGLDEKGADALLALHAQMLEAANEKQRKARELLDRLDPLYAMRAQYLEEQKRNQAEALAVDRQELARLEGLKERGLVHLADRVHEMSRMQFLSEAQFLQTQSEIERLGIQRAESDAERGRLTSDRREADLAALAGARRALFDLESQISGLQRALALAAAPGAAPVATPLSVAPEAIVHRGTGDGAVELRPGMDALVRPGDVIEVVTTDTTAPDPTAYRPASLTGAVP